jgi:hypothetical protein
MLSNQAEKVVIDYFQTDGKNFWSRYYSPNLLAAVVKKMGEDKLLTTSVSAGIAFSRLVEAGIVERTDGKDDEIDQAEAHAAAKRGLEAAIILGSAAPLTRDEVEYFGSLSQFDLSQLYYADGGINGFAVRYRKAMAEHGFREPAHFAGGLR